MRDRNMVNLQLAEREILTFKAKFKWFLTKELDKQMKGFLPADNSDIMDMEGKKIESEFQHQIEAATRAEKGRDTHTVYGSLEEWDPKTQLTICQSTRIPLAPIIRDLVKCWYAKSSFL